MAYHKFYFSICFLIPIEWTRLCERQFRIWRPRSKRLISKSWINDYVSRFSVIYGYLNIHKEPYFSTRVIISICNEMDMSVMININIMPTIKNPKLVWIWAWGNECKSQFAIDHESYQKVMPHIHTFFCSTAPTIHILYYLQIFLEMSNHISLSPPDVFMKTPWPHTIPQKTSFVGPESPSCSAKVPIYVYLFDELFLFLVFLVNMLDIVGAGKCVLQNTALERLIKASNEFSYHDSSECFASILVQKKYLLIV